jgi:hypothetical protein
VVGAYETFLRDSVSSRAVAIKGYKCVRNLRIVRKGLALMTVGLVFSTK